MKTRRISLAKIALGIAPLAYLGLVAPAWAIATQYVPPTNEVEAPTHTVQVESGHLVDEWSVQATVDWTDTETPVSYTHLTLPTILLV